LSVAAISPGRNWLAARGVGVKDGLSKSNVIIYNISELPFHK